MEDKVLNIFDDLEIEEVEELLNCDISMDLDKKTTDRIKKSVFGKAGFRIKNYLMPKALVACVAAAIILVTSLSIIGIDNVKAAIQQVFSFIPGYGIVENDDEINYILSDTVSAENETAILTLNNAIATKDNITVMFTIERKNYSEVQLIKDKQKEWEQLQKSDKLVQPVVVLSTDENNYTEHVGGTSSGGTLDTSNFTYTLKPNEINKDMKYKLIYQDFNLSLEFKLKDYQTYSDLNEIGATAYNNNISLTAVPNFDGDHVEVTLYPINKSQYSIDSFNKIYYGYQGNDLNLETNSGTKSYSIPEGFNDNNPKYIFEVNASDTNFTLNIPYIVVQSDEYKNISLPIPKDDQVINVNKKVEFKDATMTIVSVKKVNTVTDENDSLMLKLRFDNKQSNLIMCSAQYNRINFLGSVMSGGYSSVLDTNDLESTVYIDLEKGDKGSLRLKISDPLYYMTDGFKLKFDRE